METRKQKSCDNITQNTKESGMTVDKKGKNVDLETEINSIRNGVKGHKVISFWVTWSCPPLL